MKKELIDAFLAIDKPLHDLTNAIKDALDPLITVLEVTKKPNTDTKVKCDPPEIVAARMSKIIDEDLAQGRLLCGHYTDDLAEARDIEERNKRNKQ